MTTIDFRTRLLGDAGMLDLDAFVAGELATALEVHGSEAARAAQRFALPPVTFDVDGDPVTLDPAGYRITVRRVPDDALVVALDRHAFSDLMQDIVSTFGVQMTGRAVLSSGSLDDWLRWEPVLRCLLDGRPVYEPGAVDFRDRDGGALELRQPFTLDDDRSEIGHFLVQAGFLHLRSVFTADEMSAVSADLDDAMRAAERDDGASWWARTEADEWYPSRILGFNQKSPALRELLRSERFAAVGTMTDDDFVQRNPDVGDSAEGLLKRIGVVEGISDVSWHKDCSMGGHSRGCCGLIVGISLSDAGRENGELGVVAGSHRANVPHLGIDGLDLPRLPLSTRSGDLTVHCSCTLHMSRPPVSGERRVVYTGFGLAPRPGDRRVERSADEIRRARAVTNDHVIRQQHDGDLARTSASFDL